MFEKEEKKFGASSEIKTDAGRAEGSGMASLEDGIKSALGVKAPIKLPEIHAMPDKLIGAPAGRAPVVRELVVTKEQENKAVPPPPPKAPKKKKINVLLISALVVVLLAVIASLVILYVPFGKKIPLANVNNNVNLNINKPPPINENVNVNVNENENVNLNENVNVPPPPPRSGADSDSDGLTDIEETTIYLSNPYNPDTDKDSFIDGNEVVHLFDPDTKEPALLKDSVNVRMAQNAADSYSVIVPAKWIDRGAGTDEYFIDAPSGEFMEIIATVKPVEQAILDWYLAASPTAKAGDVERLRTYQGLDALRSADRLTAYVDAGDRVLTVTYNKNDAVDYQFLSTFEMVIASLKSSK